MHDPPGYIRAREEHKEKLTLLAAANEVVAIEGEAWNDKSDKYHGRRLRLQSPFGKPVLTQTSNWTDHFRDGPFAVPLLRVPYRDERISAPRGKEAVVRMQLGRDARGCVPAQHKFRLSLGLIIMAQGGFEAGEVENPDMALACSGVDPLPTPAKDDLVRGNTLLVRRDRRALCGRKHMQRVGLVIVLMPLGGRRFCGCGEAVPCFQRSGTLRPATRPE